MSGVPNFWPTPQSRFRFCTAVVHNTAAHAYPPPTQRRPKFHAINPARTHDAEEGGAAQKLWKLLLFLLLLFVRLGQMTHRFFAVLEFSLGGPAVEMRNAGRWTQQEHQGRVQFKGAALSASDNDDDDVVDWTVFLWRRKGESEIRVATCEQEASGYDLKYE
ncbi:hypothetical protein GALMADRAFT_212104 [Galerina marginata CBS 339.88]|uniref:Uncharacterized protein n=1 Tax=Galerina marginata (strain CBS 339.88) TaxID=685588 RepID=A0A067SSJ4_GALM3|nr:hypothetical protein GALMADRAFT_212104 [Galerina marginata CBS 339.88]